MTFKDLPFGLKPDMQVKKVVKMSLVCVLSSESREEHIASISSKNKRTFSYFSASSKIALMRLGASPTYLSKMSGTRMTA